MKRTCDSYYLGDLVEEGDDGRLTLAANPAEGEDGEGPCKICKTYAEQKAKYIAGVKAAEKSGVAYSGDVPVLEFHQHQNREVFAYPELKPRLKDLLGYDTIIVAFSGGKDSLACFLHLLDLGVPREMIELWHHAVDGREAEEHPDSEERDFADWPITSAYSQAVADAFGVPLYFSWISGGFEKEMLLDGEAPAPTYYETPEGVEVRFPLAKTRRTRLKFPQKSGTLTDGTRWCTPLLKIDVGKKALTHSKRFTGKKVLFITGERAEESANRSFYPQIQSHAADLRYSPKAPRHIDHWRPVHAWDEAKVWEIIGRYGVTPHPCYSLGFGRCSCAICIFGSPSQFASFKAAMPERFSKLVRYEQAFDTTIDRKLSLPEYIRRGAPYAPITDPRYRKILDTLRSKEWPASIPILLRPDKWNMPAGAFGESDGPT